MQYLTVDACVELNRYPFSARQRWDRCRFLPPSRLHRSFWLAAYPVVAAGRCPTFSHSAGFGKSDV